MIHKLFTIPIKSLIALAEKIQEEAEDELYDTSSIQRQLVDLYSRYDEGLVSEASLSKQEAELLRRYKIARARAVESRDLNE